jgi:hypothetical protein
MSHQLAHHSVIVIVGLLTVGATLVGPTTEAPAGPTPPSASSSQQPIDPSFGDDTRDIHLATDGNTVTLKYHSEDGIPMTNTGVPPNKNDTDDLGQPVDSEVPPVWSCGQVDTGGGPLCMCGYADKGLTQAAPTLCAPGAPTTPPPPPPTPAVNLDDLVKDGQDTIHLPDGAPTIRPDPANNEWDALAVGFPIWLTTDADVSRHVTSTYTAEGVTLSFDAVWHSATFDMGEPNVDPVTCTAMASRPADLRPANTPSPDCGYVYTHKGTYQVTAASQWLVTWTANGKTGTFPMTTVPATTTLDIVELHAVNVAVPG